MSNSQRLHAHFNESKLKLAISGYNIFLLCQFSFFCNIKLNSDTCLLLFRDTRYMNSPIPLNCPRFKSQQARADHECQYTITLCFSCLDGLIQTRGKVARVKKSVRTRAEGE